MIFRKKFPSSRKIAASRSSENYYVFDSDLEDEDIKEAVRETEGLSEGAFVSVETEHHTKNGQYRSDLNNPINTNRGDD